MIFSMEKSKKSKKKKTQKFLMYHTARKDLVNFDFFGLKKIFLAFFASKCQILPHKNSSEPWISWKIPWRRKKVHGFEDIL